MGELLDVAEIERLCSRLFWQALQVVFVCATAPLVHGTLRHLRGRLQKRRPVSIWQSYSDLAKLYRVPSVRWHMRYRYFRWAALFATVIPVILASQLPVLHAAPPGQADLLMIIYILALDRFLINLAGLDARAAFGWLGSARQAYVSMATELGMFVVAFGMILLVKNVAYEEQAGRRAEGTAPARQVTAGESAHPQLGVLLSLHRTSQFLGSPERQLWREPAVWFLGVAFFMLVRAESGRIPVGNPETHLELTMADRAITLEYGGRDLGLIELGHMIKFNVLLMMFCVLFLPLPVEGFEITAENTFFHNVLIAVSSVVLIAVQLMLVLLVLAILELSSSRLPITAAIEPSWIAMGIALVGIILLAAEFPSQD